MTKYVLPVGIGSGWSLDEVEIEGRLLEQHDGCKLFKLSDGRHVLHIQSETGYEIRQVESSGRQRVKLEDVLVRL